MTFENDNLQQFIYNNEFITKLLKLINYLFH